MTLAYRRVGAGEPLLLLHGLGSQWQVWEPVLALLSRERDVAAVDLPGFGESPPFEPDVAPTPDRIARSVAALLDELGWKDPHVAGNSLGGWVALELARMGRARSVVAISPAGLWSSGELRFARSSLRASRWVARALRPVLPAAMATAAGRTLLLSQMCGRPWRIPAGAAATALKGFATCPGFTATFEAVSQPDGFRHGDQIACPVTVAWGTRDRILLPRQLRRVALDLPAAHIVSLSCRWPKYRSPRWTLVASQASLCSNVPPTRSAGHSARCAKGPHRPRS